MQRVFAVLAIIAIVTGDARYTSVALIGQAAGEKEDPARGVYTCKDIGLCAAEHERLLVDSGNAGLRRRLEQRGCAVRRALKDTTALACPPDIDVTVVRPERVFTIEDMTSDVQIRATETHAIGRTGVGVKVAILDTGIDAAHIEFNGHILAQQSFTTEPVQDGNGHGTVVAGVIAGQGVQERFETGTSNRALGVSPGVQLLIAKVCQNSGHCMEGDIMAGIEWAVNQGADIINMSFGRDASITDCDSDPLAAKVNWAVDLGVLVVASAGNNGNSGQGILTPACASKAIAVGAVNADNERQSWSAYGDPLDLMAPAVSVLSTTVCLGTPSCYGVVSGTSVAAPHVSGVGALLLEEDMSLLPLDIREFLQSSAVDLGDSGKDIYYGYGVVDARNAIHRMRDRDNDGVERPTDCNDANAFVYPGAWESCNRIDDDCNGIIDDGYDLDGDGYVNCNGDCDDSNPAISLAAEEICGNGIDEDCDGMEDDACSGAVSSKKSSSAGFVPLPVPSLPGQNALKQAASELIDITDRSLQSLRDQMATAKKNGTDIGDMEIQLAEIQYDLLRARQAYARKDWSEAFLQVREASKILRTLQARGWQAAHPAADRFDHPMPTDANTMPLTAAACGAPIPPHHDDIAREARMETEPLPSTESFPQASSSSSRSTSNGLLRWFREWWYGE
jgi:subtilisin